MVEGDIDDPRKGKTLSAYADLRGGEGAFRAYPSTSAFASTTVGTDFLPVSKSEEYVKKLGPSYLPGIPQQDSARNQTDSRLSFNLPVSTRPQRPGGSNAEKYQNSGTDLA